MEIPVHLYSIKIHVSKWIEIYSEPKAYFFLSWRITIQI